MAIKIGEPAGTDRDGLRNLLRQICPEANLHVADGGSVSANPVDFCSRGNLSGACRCICDLVTSGKTISIRANADLSAHGGGRTSADNDNDSVNGTGSDQTVEIEIRNRYRERRRDNGQWTDVPDWIILAHELCGHALPGMKGTEKEWRPWKPGYSRDWHRDAEEVEDKIRSERRLLPRGTNHGLKP